ncbi:hypothetical protein B0H19DRAFT_1122684, partial [Mycena capillaripes]
MDQDDGQSDSSIVEVEGPSSRTSTSAIKIKIEEPTETTPAAIANKNPLFIDDSGSESESPFPLVLSDFKPLAAVGQAGTLSCESGSGLTTSSTIPVYAPPTISAIPASTPATAPAATNTIPGATLSAGLTSTNAIPGLTTPASSTTSSTSAMSTTIQNTIFGAIPTFRSADVLPVHASSAHTAPSTSAVHASSSTCPSGSSQSSSLHTLFADDYYASSTAGLESFNEFGNYRERTPPKRPLEAMIGSGFPSPDRPANNPWKRRKSD